MNINQRKVGVIISYLSQMVHILTGLLYTPIMLRLLGQSEYGLYQLVYSIVSYLSLLSLGFGASYMRFYSREKAKKDDKGIARLNGMFMLIFGAISVISILCGVVMISNIRGIFGTGLTDNEYRIAKVLMGLMIVNLSMTFPNSVFNCIITSQERFLFQKTIILFQYLLNPFITLPLLIAGYGSIGMVAVTTFLTFLVLISNTYYCIKRLHAKFEFRNLKFSMLKEMWVFTFFIFLNQIVDQINWSVDKFLLGRIIGTTAVSVYGVGGQINTLYLQFSTSVSSVFVPKVNRIVAETGDNWKLTELFTKVGRIQFMIMALILSGFTFFGKSFIRFWAGAEYGQAYWIALFLLYPVTVPLIQNLGIEIQRAKNKHKTRSVVYLLIAIVNIFISIPLIKMFGAVGAAIGTAISLFAGNIVFMNWYYHCRLEINMFYFWKHIISFSRALIIPVIYGGISMICFEYTSLFKLAAGITGYVILYGGSFYLLGLNEEEKDIILGSLRRKMRKNYDSKKN